jgi:hypothetical protein
MIDHKAKYCHREPLMHFQRRGDLLNLRVDSFARGDKTGFLVIALLQPGGLLTKV